MSADWPRISLTDIYDIRSGLSKPASAFGTGYPFLTFKEVFKNCFVPDSLPQLVESTEFERENSSIKRGDVFLTRTSETIDELGMSCVALKDYEGATFNGFTKRLRPKSHSQYQVHPEYIGYFLRGTAFRRDMLALSTMSTRASLNNEMIGRLPVLLPPMAIQHGVAKVLKCLDEKIDLNRCINKTLEATAQAIFKSWFVDFDPVKAKITAKAEGPDPLRAAMRAISGKVDAELDALPREHYDPLAAAAVLFPDEIEASARGCIPRGWKMQAAETIADVGIGKTPPRKEPQWFTEEDGDWRWMSIRDMGAGGVFQQRSSEFLTTEAVSRFNVKVVPDRTALLSFKLTIGRVAITDGPMVTNEAIAHFKLAADSAITTEYLYLFLKNFDYSTLGSTSSIADAVNSKTIREMPILVPEKNLVSRFVHLVRPFFEEIRTRQIEMALLAETRDALLPKLLSGEIEVPA